MAEFEKVCQMCGGHFKARGKNARFCPACAKRRNDEAIGRHRDEHYKDYRLKKDAVKQQEKTQYSFKPAKCPDDCVYLQLFESKRQLCGFFLMTDELRGCDPGPGCKRYVSMKSGPKHRRAKWDVEKGRMLWEQGRTDLEIAKELHIRSRAVKAYRLRVWEKENHHDGV